MSWFFLIQGKCMNISIENGYDLVAKLEATDKYQILKTECATHGLVLNETVDTEGDLDKVALMLGYELYPDRHSYQGFTVTVKPVVNMDYNLLDSLSSKLIDCVADVTDFPKLKLTMENGIIYSQFD